MYSASFEKEFIPAWRSRGSHCLAVLLLRVQAKVSTPHRDRETHGEFAAIGSHKVTPLAGSGKVSLITKMRGCRSSPVVSSGLEDGSPPLRASRALTVCRCEAGNNGNTLVSREAPEPNPPAEQQHAEIDRGISVVRI